MEPIKNALRCPCGWWLAGAVVWVKRWSAVDIQIDVEMLDEEAVRVDADIVRMTDTWLAHARVTDGTDSRWVVNEGAAGSEQQAEARAAEQQRARTLIHVISEFLLLKE